MLQLQFPSSQTLNPKLCPFPCSSNTKGNSFSSISLTGNLSTKKKKLSIKCRQSEYYEQKSYGAAPNNSSFAPTELAVGGLPPRVFVGHSIYKGKAALTVEPKAPEFVSLDVISKTNQGHLNYPREGFVLLQFAPAAGVRQYDWSRKQVFSLSVTEVGNLVSLGARESCEFFHDPFKGKSEEGKVRKVLKVEPLPDGSGHFFNLSVQNKLINLDESIYIPITRAEYTVLVSAFNFILPYLLGWHAYANSIKPEDTSRTNNANPRYGGDYEWNR
ncbi:Single-stranded DNA-binding protein WHY1, chloroplastic [Melia azedarach]|uniref:Single-stranded DNA-binding protein WHY1, chloroplastic n=1 Tax=Melia azedarach TaxID=155640 RepID=A0ACC1XIQ0_MELAZ|nr:Single-stranded DNA-binding protein WHY1, chloroplastic [Melia azedarach]